MAHPLWLLGLFLLCGVYGCKGKASSSPTSRDAESMTASTESTGEGSGGTGLDTAGATNAEPTTSSTGSGEPPDVLHPSPDCQLPEVAPSCTDGLCRVEAGCFIMGAPRTEFAIAKISDIQVEVRLTRAFLIGQTEVTRSVVTV